MRMPNILQRVLGVIVATFVIAIMYGIIATTIDFTNPGYDPEASGHHAADKVYGLFGTVSGEIKRNDEDSTPKVTTVMQKIAMPYALTSDLTAIFCGKVELAIRALFRRLDIGN